MMTGFRYVILLIGLFSYCCLISNILTLNFAVVCDASTNETALINYDTSEMNFLFSIVAFGNIVGTIPIQYLYQKIGPKNTFILYLMISLISTALNPFGLMTNYFIMLGIRFMQGFSWAIALPGLGSMTYAWAPIIESGIYMTTLSTSGQTAPLITMYLSSQLCTNNFGSSSIFYVHSLISLFFLIIYFIFYKDYPEDSKYVSQEELKKIKKEKGSSDKRKTSKEPVPYKKVFLNPTLSVGNITYFIYFLSMHLWMQYAAIYMNIVLEYDVATTGMITSFPYFFGIGVKFLYGFLSDKENFCVLPVVLRILQGTSQITTVQIILGGSASVAIFKSCLLVSQQHFHFVMSIASIANSVALLLVPSLVNIIMPNFEIEGWKALFTIIGSLTVISNIGFLIVMKTEPEKWTKNNNTKNNYNETNTDNNAI
ncbi:Major facilitator superfamily and Major facilitator superfamily domain, general substrate transporter-containing protein [Strongyloides ratti]|uniref:Major facilitator superfamily and Major facilitator superfamily domain, general substrate transporter-containing protein n=1 Tax=Strongyloides ratti TaxID=34506 RepID=A0A090LHI4_STRRB|nr:Major facilitator superfamily and Major facilitator superfamily domain, general substrate transporter-containing protein [Strongyloides ratti]CEF69241.1 Major facilitator superfamily and Major facilitator superfamily domain, general substrate transporter-containing protein [Strongyloides ratti]